jgi:hypothetical protein
MKQLPKHPRTRKAGGGARQRLSTANAKNRRRPQKNFSKKHEAYDRISRVQFDREGLLFVGSDRAARERRDRVESALLVNVSRLLRLALDAKDRAPREWAGEVLANISSRIAVEDRKLLKANKSYRDWKRKIGKKLGTVLHPTATISRVVQVELAVAESVGQLLAVLDFTGDGWKQEAKRLGIPECYWPVLDLPELSEKSEPLWWKLLWERIKKTYPGLLMALRNQSVSNAALNNTFRWATVRRRFRQRLQLIARRRDQGVR